MSAQLPKMLLIALGLTLAVSACKPPPPKVVMTQPDGTEAPPPPEPPDESEEKAAKAVADSAQTLETSGDVDGAQAKRDELLKDYPGTEAAASVYLARGKKALAEGDRRTALTQFEKLLYYRPQHPEAATHRRTYGELLLEAQRFKEAAAQLRAAFDATSDPAEKLALADLLAKALRRGGGAQEALEIQVGLRNTKGLPKERRDQAEREALETVSHQLTLKGAESTWNDHKNDDDWAFLHPVLAFKLAKIYNHVRDFDRAAEMLKLTVEKYGTTVWGIQAKAFAERLEKRFVVRPSVVGAVLPLSGRFAKFGERSLAAIKIALAGSDVKLVVKDSKGDATTASAAVEELVYNDQAIAIIGPFFSNASSAAALKAEELSVPILTLSHRDGLPDIGEWVFRTALTVKAQAKALADLAFDQMGFSRFAVLYPQGPYGEEFLHAFWDEVDKRKGEIRGVESYAHDQTTFQVQARLVVGRYYRMARGEYLNELARLRAQKLPSHRFSAALEDFQQTLNPVVDFDAIIIPDSGKNVGLIAPALAFEDVVFTRDPKMLRTIRKTTGNSRVHPVTLMGGSTWNSPDIVERCERYCEEAMFVDGYYPDNPSPKAREFVKAFRAATKGAEPHLSDAQAYDTAALLRFIIESSHPAERSAMRTRLVEEKSFSGVTGPLLFDEVGEPKKKLFEFTIQERQIKEWKPTPKKQG